MSLNLSKTSWFPFLLIWCLFLPLGLDYRALTFVEVIILMYAIVCNFKFVISGIKSSVLIWFVLAINLAESLVTCNQENCFQIVRGMLGPLFLVIFLPVLSDHNTKFGSEYKLESKFILYSIISIGFIAIFNSYIHLKQNITIDVTDGLTGNKRIFIGPHTLLILLCSVFLSQKRYLISLSTFVVVLVSGSRGGILAVIMPYFIHLIKYKNKYNYKALSMIFAGFIIVSFFYSEPILRLAQMGVSDSSRYRELEALYAQFINKPWRLLFGMPFTMPYWNGYFDFVDYNPQFHRTYVNSMYDVHNGYAFIIYKFGLVGGWCFGKIFYNYYKNNTDAFPILMTYMILCIVSSAPIMTVDGAFGIVFATFFARQLKQKEGR